MSSNYNMNEGWWVGSRLRRFDDLQTHLEAQSLRVVTSVDHVLPLATCGSGSLGSGDLHLGAAHVLILLRVYAETSTPPAKSFSDAIRFST